MKARVRSFTVLWMLVIVCCGASFAARPHQDCSNPSVFRGADVNIVVLPYVSAGSDSLMDEVGQRLALLVKLDTFAHVLDYGSLGATQMEVPPGVDPNTCLPQVVIPKLLAQVPGADVTTEKGKGLIIVWGVLYQEGDDIVIQSYARFLRQGTSEALSVPVGGFVFTGQPSSQVVSFEPRSFKQGLLEEIERSYQRSDVVHTAPRDDAPGEPLPRPVAKCISCRGELTPGYQVQEQRGEWIHVRWMDPKQEMKRDGWIHAAGSFSGKSLDSVLPELHFIKGCVGYLKQRMAGAGGSKLSPQLAASAVKEFRSFVEANGRSAVKATTAVALELAGMIQMAQGDVSGAQETFQTAAGRVPSDADAATLASIAQIAKEWSERKSVGNSGEVAERLTRITTISKDPNAALGNLKSFLRLLQTIPAASLPANFSGDALKKKIEAVDRIKLPAS